MERLRSSEDQFMQLEEQMKQLESATNAENIGRLVASQKERTKLFFNAAGQTLVVYRVGDPISAGSCNTGFGNPRCGNAAFKDDVINVINRHVATNKSQQSYQDTLGFLDYVLQICNQPGCYYSSNCKSWIYMLLTPANEGKVHVTFAKVDSDKRYCQWNEIFINHLMCLNEYEYQAPPAECIETRQELPVEWIQLLRIIAFPPEVLDMMKPKKLIYAAPNPKERYCLGQGLPGSEITCPVALTDAFPWPDGEDLHVVLHDTSNDVREHPWSPFLQLKSAERAKCVVCMEEDPTHACVPCGHLCLCEECKDKTVQQADNRCAVCRAVVRNFMHIYQ
jgi:hypothetical protein